MPVGRIFESFGLFAQCGFLCQVRGHFFLYLVVVVTFGGKEIVACFSETCKQLVIDFARCETYFFPFFLCGENGLGHLVPCRETLDGSEVDGFDPFAKCGFFSLVPGFAGFPFFEKCLIFLIHHSRGFFEPRPYLLAQFFCHGSGLAPFVVKVLEAFECQDYILSESRRSASSHIMVFSSRFLRKS